MSRNKLQHPSHACQGGGEEEGKAGCLVGSTKVKGGGCPLWRSRRCARSREGWGFLCSDGNWLFTLYVNQPFFPFLFFLERFDFSRQEAALMSAGRIDAGEKRRGN